MAITLSTLGNGVDSGHTPPQHPSCSSRVLAICSSDLCSAAFWDMMFLKSSLKVVCSGRQQQDAHGQSVSWAPGHVASPVLPSVQRKPQPSAPARSASRSPVLHSQNNRCRRILCLSHYVMRRSVHRVYPAKATLSGNFEGPTILEPKPRSG